MEAEGDPVEDAVVGEAGEPFWTSLAMRTVSSCDQVGAGAAVWAMTVGAESAKTKAAASVGRVRRVRAFIGSFPAMKSLVAAKPYAIGSVIPFFLSKGRAFSVHTGASAVADAPNRSVDHLDCSAEPVEYLAGFIASWSNTRLVRSNNGLISNHRTSARLNRPGAGLVVVTPF